MKNVKGLRYKQSYWHIILNKSILPKAEPLVAKHSNENRSDFRIEFREIGDRYRELAYSYMTDDKYYEISYIKQSY